MNMFKKIREQKNSLIIHIVIFFWIVLVNLIVQLTHAKIMQIGYCNWAFFLITVLFFLDGETDTKRKYKKVLVGSLIGILLAGLFTAAETMLAEQGISIVVAIMIPLAICLGLIIILQPVFPVVFNNCCFAYFLVSLMDAEHAFSGIPAYAGSTLAGHLIVNSGTLVIIYGMKKYLEAKSKPYDES